MPDSNEIAPPQGNEELPVVDPVSRAEQIAKAREAISRAPGIVEQDTRPISPVREGDDLSVIEDVSSQVQSGMLPTEEQRRKNLGPFDSYTARHHQERLDSNGRKNPITGRFEPKD